MKTLGVMRIKNESRWIKQSIESQLPLCDKVLIFDDHSTDDTRDIVGTFKDRCELLVSPFEGLDEARDKNFILRRIIEEDPDWVLWIDGDEALERSAPDKIKPVLANESVGAAALRLVYFWNSLDQVRVDGAFAFMGRVVLFRVRGQRPAQLRFPEMGGANFHCGNCPEGIAGSVLPMTEVHIKHYGYVDLAERQRKYEFYNKHDPGNEGEDCYRHIIETPGARLAPGPTVLRDWKES